jgi:hypothetical protein
MTGENDSNIKVGGTITTMRKMKKRIRDNKRNLYKSKVREFNLERLHKKIYDNVTQRDISVNAYKIDDETGETLSIIYYNALPQSSAIDPGNFDSRDLLPTYDNRELNKHERDPGRNDCIGNEFDDREILNFLIKKRKQEDKKYE